MENELKAVGYWRKHEDSTEDLPWPDKIRKLPDDIKHKVILYLVRGDCIDQARGFSACRICGYAPNGSCCMTDGVFKWPEGYSHYISEHDVMVDPELLAHILTTPEKSVS
jgi:hypothetical protein